MGSSFASAASRSAVSAQIIADSGQSPSKNMCSVAQTDTLCTKLMGSNCVVGRVGVGADTGDTCRPSP